MFKSITYLTPSEIGNQLFYWLEDDDFKCEVAVTPRTTALDAIDQVAMISEYQRRLLPVARNLTIYYQWLKNRGANVKHLWLEWDRKWIDRWHPELMYGTKYYPCVLNQIKQSQWSNPKIRIL